MTSINASMLYNLLECPHRTKLDLYEDPGNRDPVSPFVKLLWERGTKYEQEVIAELELDFLDLSPLPSQEKIAATQDAMRNDVPLIYAGRIEADDLIGEPDLLRKECFI